MSNYQRFLRHIDNHHGRCPSGDRSGWPKWATYAHARKIAKLCPFEEWDFEGTIGGDPISEIMTPEGMRKRSVVAQRIHPQHCSKAEWAIIEEHDFMRDKTWLRTRGGNLIAIEQDGACAYRVPGAAPLGTGRMRDLRIVTISEAAR